MSATFEKPKNRQLFENSGLKELFAQETANGNIGAESEARPFFNQRDPNLAIMHEKPEHRTLLMLKASGLSNREIAQSTGYTEPWLSQLFRQPWAQSLLSEFITSAGVDTLQTLIKSEAEPSMRKLIELRDNPETPKTVVRQTCVDILDRFMGKPAQHVHVDQTTRVTSDDVGELDKRIAELDAETKRLVGHV